MTKFGKKTVLWALSFIFALCAFSLFVFQTKKAEAGEVYGVVVDEMFKKGELDTQIWYNKNRFSGVSFLNNGNPQLVVKNGQGAIDGTGINSTTPITASNKISFTIGISEMIFGARALSADCGFFGLAYNLRSSDYQKDSAVRAVYEEVNPIPGDGIYFSYKHEQGYDGLVFATIGVGGTFIDGNGDPIEQVGSYAFFPVSGLVNEPSVPAITNTVITIEIDKSGILVCKNGNDILFQSDPSHPMPTFKNGTYFGISVHRTVASIESTIINEFTARYDGNIVNSFTAANRDKWNFFSHHETPEAYFAPKYTMSLGSAFTENSPLFLSKEIFLNETEDSFGEITAKVKAINIAGGANFGILTGVSNYTKEKVGSKNTTFVYLNPYGGNFYLGIKTYDENGNANVLVRAPQDGIIATPDENGFVEIYVKIDNKGIIKVSLNGAEKYTSNSTVAKCHISGYCGIAMEGSSTGLNVQIFDVLLKNKYYSRPENVNVDEDFNYGGYNPNEFYFRQEPYMSSFTNTGGYVKDDKLWFDNLAYNTSFTTKYQYSDFEIQFDIDDIRREPVGEGASLSYPISSFVGVYWGVPDATSRFGDGVSTVYPLVYIATEVSEKTWGRATGSDGKPEPTRIFAMGNGMNASFVLPTKYDYWDTKCEGKILQLKINVTSNIVNVYLRFTTDPSGYWCHEDKNGDPLTFTMKQAVVGNVALTTMGNNYYVYPNSVGSSCGHFSVDNLKITNKDDNGNVIQSEKGTTYRELPTDYQYVKPDNDDDYAPKVGNEGGSGCGASVSGTSFAVICAIAVIGAFVMILSRRKHRV